MAQSVGSKSRLSAPEVQTEDRDRSAARDWFRACGFGESNARGDTTDLAGTKGLEITPPAAADMLQLVRFPLRNRTRARHTPIHACQRVPMFRATSPTAEADASGSRRRGDH